MKNSFLRRVGVCVLSVLLCSLCSTEAKIATRLLYAHRGDAIRRQQQLQAMQQAAQKTNAVANANGAGVSANTPANAPNPAISYTPNAVPYLVRPPQISANATNVPSRISAAKKAEPETPKSPPIYEASGPPFNDRDPLLAYQQEQADKGNPESQYAIGMRYLNGTGLEQSDQLARQWLEKASANGNLRAREKLRELR